MPIIKKRPRPLSVRTVHQHDFKYYDPVTGKLDLKAVDERTGIPMFLLRRQPAKPTAPTGESTVRIEED